MSAGNDLPAGPNGYRLLNRLGAGRTAIVYLAQHQRMGKVALKLPRDDVDLEPVLRRMFENEVMITLKLHDPHVVQGLDGKPTGASAYLALELCPGGTLDQLLLEKGRLPLKQAVELVEDVAAGLAYAHDNKVLHRDVKPANVFLTSEGRAKLGDFGTGSFMNDPSDERVGTAFYMAPELFEGATASVASDVYSLGVLAFEVVTGERPFRGETYDALMHEHLRGLLRDPRTVRGNVPDELARVVRTAMSRSADKRYGSVEAFLSAWRDATGEHRDAAPKASPKAGRSGRAGAATPPTGSGDAEAGSSDDGGADRAGWWRRLWSRGRDD